MSVKTLDDINLTWELKNQADFVTPNFTGLKWILGCETSLD